MSSHENCMEEREKGVGEGGSEGGTEERRKKESGREGWDTQGLKQL